MILLIDNYDSFTYNLVQRLGEIDPTLDLEVHRNDQITLDEIAQKQPSHLIISPGPCTPTEAGISCEAVTRFAGKLPILGVCLGHQSIGQATGGAIVRAKRLMHGKTDWIHHDNQALFAGLENPLQATRYHSLVIQPDTLHPDFIVCAWSDAPDGSREIMAIRHKTQPLFGLQFHPESFLTHSGTRLLARFLEIGAPAHVVSQPESHRAMLTVEEALSLVLAQAEPRPSVELARDQALGLALAADVMSDVDSPPHDKSIVDGYALDASDLSQGVAELEVLEEVTAGAVPQHGVSPGRSSRVMTGAPIPPGADAVVMIEYAELLPGWPERVRLKVDRVTPGQNILRRAASMAIGDRVLSAGHVLRPIEIGVLAEVGQTLVNVVPRPSLAALSTGNELVPPDGLPAAGQIRNSNGVMLMAAAHQAGATAVDLGIARDEPDELSERIARGLESDVLVISGGVSAGVLDLVPGVLASLGVEQVFHKVRLKPGKPLWFGIARRNGRKHLVFGLPGNPVSSLVCFELFVRPALAQLAGRPPLGLPATSAQLASDFAHRGERPTYHPARLALLAGQLQAEPLKWRGSADLATLAQANGLIVFPAGEQQHRAGESVRVLRWNA